MRWLIPLADLDFGEQEIEAVTGVLRSEWLTMGEVTQDFERRFADYLGVKYAFAVANCTVALHLANVVMDIGPGAEVILPSLSFVATANAVLYTGATPVFADITSLENLNISPRDIERRINQRTRAIVVMHYGGYPCSMGDILQIARRHNLAVIEDAAHAPGASINGRMMGTLGDVGCFSFFSNKNLVTGEGGMIVTDRDDLAERLRVMRSHGMTTLTWDRHRGHAYSYDVVDLGYNYRIDEIRSALGLVQLEKLTRNNQRRRALTAEYRRLLADVPGLSVPFSEHPGTSACHLFPVLLHSQIDRRSLMDGMRDQGIQTSIHYPPIHQFTYYQGEFADRSAALPLTEVVGLREITLPLYPGMTVRDVKTVVDALQTVVEEVTLKGGK
jgi:dTDP-4-amino-4,6-dideoxygalactose transaminase